MIVENYPVNNLQPTLIISTFLVFFLQSALLTFFVPRGSNVATLGTVFCSQQFASYKSIFSISAYLLLGQLSLILFSLILSIASDSRLSR